MRVDGAQRIGADSALEVAAVTARSIVAREAFAWLRARFERVPGQKVTGMGELSFDGIGASQLDEAALVHRVTVVTLLLGVAGVAQLGVAQGVVSVVSRERLVVGQKRARNQLLDLTGRMTRFTLGLCELSFVLVAFEATSHWREQLAGVADRTAVAGHALPQDRVHLQMSLMIEANAMGNWRGLEFTARGACEQRRRLIAVTPFAALDRRSAGWPSFQLDDVCRLGEKRALWLRRGSERILPMATAASQAFRFSRGAAVELGQMQFVGKARVGPFVAREQR